MSRLTLPALLVACSLARAALARSDTAREGVTAESRDVNEPEIQLLRPVLQLNQYSFNESVLAESGNAVRHWIVLFCLAWHGPCEAIDRPFAALGAEWEDRLNTGLLATEVRFAAVDCAIDRVLCNEQRIYEYPVLVHYHQHEFVTGGAVGRALEIGGIEYMLEAMAAWTSEELTPILSLREADEGEEKEELGLLDWAKSIIARRDWAVDVLVAVLAVIGNAWLVLRSLASKTEAGDSCAATAAAAEPEDVTAAGRFLPHIWARERPTVEL